MATTKYTAMFEQGNVSLRSLALRCVRDDLPMSVCASVAALPPGAPLPREIKVDPSFEQRVAEAEARVEHLAALSAEEEEAHAEDEFARHMERYRAEIGRVTTLNARLRATEAEILLWDAPAEFELLRKDMLREVRAAFVDMKYIEGFRPTQRPAVCGAPSRCALPVPRSPWRGKS